MRSWEAVQSDSVLSTGEAMFHRWCVFPQKEQELRLRKKGTDRCQPDVVDRIQGIA